MPTYDPVTRCSGRQLDGTTALATAIYDHLDPAPPAPQFARSGYNCRPKNGANGPILGTVSVHGGGRALDIRADARKTTELVYGNMLAGWLANNAAVLGTQCVMWNRRIWGGESKRWYWRSLSASSHPHTDHVHVELDLEHGQHLTLEQIMTLIDPEPVYDDITRAVGEYRTGRYPKYRVVDPGPGRGDIEITPINGAPRLRSLPELLAPFGVTRPTQPVTDAFWDPFARALVLETEADGGTFFIPAA